MFDYDMYCAAVPSIAISFWLEITSGVDGVRVLWCWGRGGRVVTVAR